MDSLRGDFGDRSAIGDAYDPSEDEIGHEPPPSAIGQDERRMQVRAYNHWASLLRDNPFPAIADLAPGSLPDFDPFSVLLDFTGGVETPKIAFVGSALARECGATPEEIRSLAEVPSRSLLSRITDHYMQIHANQAPIGFEAEFVNQLERTILYRGILLPFSRNDESRDIDFIYGVINWKELADQRTTDALLGEIDRVLESRRQRDGEPMAEWADGPADTAFDLGGDDILDLVTPCEEGDSGFDWPGPAFGVADGDLAVHGAEPSLADLLDSARELARAAQGSEDRSRQALYDAIGRAWDFALVAGEEQEDFRELVADAGLTIQERAPFTPVVKLVFGADYDKTRLTEFAAAMAHAQRLEIGRGALAGFLANAAGGLKGVVQAERRLRREEAGRTAGLRETPIEILAGKLRVLDASPLAELAAEGEEFALVLVRRTEAGEVLAVAELPGDSGLLERAAKRLLG